MKEYLTIRQRRELRAKRRRRLIIILAVVAVLGIIAVIGIPKLMPQLMNFKTISSAIQLDPDEQLNVNRSKSNVEQDSESIPDYSGQDYIVLNDGSPCFSSWDMENITGDHYSNLDSLGRCGTAYAMLDRSMMPTEERGAIGSVKPSGWKQKKYEGIVDSNPPYLYNRCHLIAYALSGQNANEKNLITGTRYMNATSMLLWEEKVMKYLDDSDNHVLYRVTPYFKDSELVARGVEMEAYSVEDAGSSLCFHVFVYNVQPGIEIDYITGDSQAE